jgi:hypothetical protein
MSYEFREEKPQVSQVVAPQAAQPQTVTAKPSRMFTFIAIFQVVVVCVLVAMLLNKDGGSPKPNPVPDVVIAENVEKMAEAAARRLLVNEAAVSERLGREVLGGSIKDSNQFFESGKSYQQAAQDEAYAEMYKLADKYIAEKLGTSRDGASVMIPWSEADKKIIAEFQKRIAEGKRRVAE